MKTNPNLLREIGLSKREIDDRIDASFHTIFTMKGAFNFEMGQERLIPGYR